MTNNDRIINSALSTSWSTADKLGHPDYWSGMMSHIDGCQSMVIATDIDNGELLDDLQDLWKLALQRRSIAYAEYAAPE